MATSDLIHAFELHDPELISSGFAEGLDVHALIGGKPPVMLLVEMYTRSPRFKACLQAMFDAGAHLDDRLVEILLRDDADSWRQSS